MIISTPATSMGRPQPPARRRPLTGDAGRRATPRLPKPPPVNASREAAGTHPCLPRRSALGRPGRAPLLLPFPSGIRAAAAATAAHRFLRAIVARSPPPVDACTDLRQTRARRARSPGRPRRPGCARGGPVPGRPHTRCRGAAAQQAQRGLPRAGPTSATTRLHGNCQPVERDAARSPR